MFGSLRNDINARRISSERRTTAGLHPQGHAPLVGNRLRCPPDIRRPFPRRPAENVVRIPDQARFGSGSSDVLFSDRLFLPGSGHLFSPRVEIIGRRPFSGRLALLSTAHRRADRHGLHNGGLFIVEKKSPGISNRQSGDNLLYFIFDYQRHSGSGNPGESPQLYRRAMLLRRFDNDRLFSGRDSK